MSKIKHGDRVTWTHKMWRKGKGECKRSWQATDWKSPGEGIFLGWRSLQCGFVESDDGWRYFSPTSRVKAALVSEGPTKNPIYVSPEGLEPVATWVMVGVDFGAEPPQVCEKTPDWIQDLDEGGG